MHQNQNESVKDDWTHTGAEQTPISRRTVVCSGLVAATALTSARLLALTGGQTSEGEPLVIRNARPLDAETPLSALRRSITPTESCFVRSHFGPPAQLAQTWQVTIDGEIERPLTLSIDDLRAMERVSRPVTLECAGNGRALFALPSSSGIQWQLGAVSTAVWTGVPLRAILQRAGVLGTAQHFWTEAPDRSAMAGAPAFLRSVPRSIAESDALVAYAMNGAPIPALQGGPLRLIVPGWFGMASTKWLTHIHARAVESDNHFMVRGYRYGDGSAVTTLRTKSLITSPLADAQLRPGRVTVSGQAWTSLETGGIRMVELSMDGGATWRETSLVGEPQPGAWRGWETTVDLPRGDVVLMARATDRAGGVQPMRAAPNGGGYGNNSVHQVAVHVG